MNKDLIKEISKITLKKDEYLVFKLSDEIGMGGVNQLRDVIELVFKEDAERILVVCGDMEITKINFKDLK